MAISHSSSLGAFLETMYKKRELEYKAAYNQYEADVAGAKALGEGFSQFGEGIGGALGSYMKGQQYSQGESIANKLGGQAFGQGWLGGGTQEMALRQKMGQFDSSGQFTPYQQAQQELGNRRLEETIRHNEAMENASNEAKSRAAAQNQSKKFSESVADMDSYQAQTTENMTKLYQAETPEVFDTHRKRQISLNEGAMARGISQDRLQFVPSEFIPPKQRKAYEFYQYQQQFPQGTTNPAEMSRRREAAEMESSTDLGQPAVSYGTGPGQARPPTYSTGIPAGAVADPNFRGPRGSTANNGAMVWNGQFWVPRQ